MNAPALPFARRLHDKQFLKLRPRRRLCLRAERGTLWITVDGELSDITLDAGQSQVFEPGQRLLVGALGGAAAFSAVALHSPRPWWQALAAPWRAQVATA